jgi:hypothetical protein
MGDELLSFADPRLGLVTKVSDECHGVGAKPTTPGGQPSKPIGRPLRSLAQDDGVVGDLDIESIARFDGELPSSFARHDDLVLGADLYT